MQKNDKSFVSFQVPNIDVYVCCRMANLATSQDETEIDGVSFKNCSFKIGSKDSGNQAIRYYNENNNGNVKNLTVQNCTFENCYQGIYTMNINGIKVTGSRFNTMAHNAIAIQSVNGVVNHGNIVLTHNTFSNIGDRIIRFGDVGAGTSITIQNNTAVNCGDSDGEVIKASSLAEGIQYQISANSWGEGKSVVNHELADK